VSEEFKEMSFFDHLEELRWRLFRAGLVVVAFALIAFIFKGFIFDEIIFAPTRPDFIAYEYWCLLIQKMGLGQELCLGNFDFKIINTEMAGQFMVHIKIAMSIGVIVAFPYLVWELWRFISPGLKLNELKSSRFAILGSALLFFFGVFFGYFVLTPFSLDFLSKYNVSDIVFNTFTLTNYISFISMLVFASGIMFQLPMAVFLLAKMKIITGEMMVEYWRYAFIVCLILSAIITPPDLASMVMVAIPLFGLYLLSILIAKKINPQIK
jgi:sec-independent protein translocase protein TatC